MRLFFCDIFRWLYLNRQIGDPISVSYKNNSNSFLPTGSYFARSTCVFVKPVIFRTIKYLFSIRFLGTIICGQSALLVIFPPLSRLCYGYFRIIAYGYICALFGCGVVIVKKPRFRASGFYT